MENNRIICLKEEIANNTKDFIKEIECICREGFEYDRDFSSDYTSGFPIFGLADPVFFRSRNQVNELEWYVRKMLVNRTLDYLFKYYKYDVRWKRGFDGHPTLGLTNNYAVEARTLIEFIIVKDGIVSAFRYTPFESDYKIEENIPRHPKLFSIYLQSNFDVSKVDEWVSIEWEDICYPAGEKRGFYTDGREKKCWYITIKELFLKYFSLDEYNIFIDGIKEAVSKANEMIRFHTFTKLSINNLGLKRIELQAATKNIDFFSLYYSPVCSCGRQSGDTKRLNDHDTEILRQKYIGKSRFLALTGVKDFAKSFITAEYLYQIFQNSLPIDYTSIVSGYIKCIEQLCAALIYDIIIPQFSNSVYILLKGSLTKEEFSRLSQDGSLKKYKDMDYISAKPENKVFFKDKDKITLGQMTYFFELNKSIVFDLQAQDNIFVIIDCLRDYANYCRNGFFHKHNIDTKDIVEIIRNNTLILLFFLLGSIKISIPEARTQEMLGIVDDTFDQLYRKIAFRCTCYGSETTFKLVYPDGLEYCNLKLTSRPTYEFDEFGFIVSKLNFTDFSKENDKNPKSITQLPIVVDREHLPKEIYMTEHQTEFIERELIKTSKTTKIL